MSASAANIVLSVLAIAFHTFYFANSDNSNKMCCLSSDTTAETTQSPASKTHTADVEKQLDQDVLRRVKAPFVRLLTQLFINVEENWGDRIVESEENLLRQANSIMLTSTGGNVALPSGDADRLTSFPRWYYCCYTTAAAVTLLLSLLFLLLLLLHCCQVGG